MAWVVEMTGFDPVAEEETTVLFSMGPGIPFTDADYAVGALMRWSSASQRVEFGADGMVKTTGDTGEITLVNAPDTVWEGAPLDDQAKWVWQGRDVALYSVPGRLWSERVKVAEGIVEQPVANLSVGGSMSSVLRFVIRDQRAALETPLQPAKFAGDNEGPVGVEGGPDLKGRPKPVMYGLVSNISPPRVNDSLLIYQLADVAVTVLCVRDGGFPLAPGVGRANLASLQANDPLSGAYDYYAGAEGTFIRLGSTPIFNLTCDADEAATEADQGHAKIWSRLRGDRIDSTIDAASVTAAQAVDSHGAGFYWDQEVSQLDAVDQVLSSFSGYEVLQANGSWKIEKLVIPTGTPVIEIEQVTPTSRMKAKTRRLSGLTMVRPQYAPDGSPPYRVNVKWGRNHTIMQPSEFAGAASERLKAKFAEEFRIESVSDADIWDPVAKTGAWKNAPELTVETGYQPGAGGITSPGAAAEATRIMALLGPMRNQFQVSHVFKIGDYLLPGQVAKLTYPRMDLASGALFRILEASLKVENGEATSELVIGLQA